MARRSPKRGVRKPSEMRPRVRPAQKPVATRPDWNIEGAVEELVGDERVARRKEGMKPPRETGRGWRGSEEKGGW